MSAVAVLAIDQGTTNTKALLVGTDGAIIARASRPMTLSHPRPGWAEQSAEDIWASVAAVIADVVAAAPRSKPTALAISNQRETVVLWDSRTGRPIAPAISWQCRRSSDRCAALRAGGHEALISERTGLGLDPLFPAAKLGWLLDELPSARCLAQEGLLRAGTIDAWLLWNLTDGRAHATDHGNASRTQLFNLHTQAWDAELADLFGVPLALLPKVQSSDSLFGRTGEGTTVLGAGTPIHAMMGDSHAALFGHGVAAPGSAKVTIGTGSSIMSLTASPVRSSNGLSTTIAWSQGGVPLYALEGNITVSGQAAAFAAQLFGIADEEALSALAQTVDDSGGVTFVPALAGLGAPHWQDKARGLIAGLTLGTTPAHIARAVLEAIALQIVDVFEAMEADVGHALPGVRTDGGATRNTFLLQLLADLLDRPVSRLADAEVSALGVARMAAHALDAESSSPSRWREQRVRLFLPTMTSDRRQAIRNAWGAAVRQATLDL
jgi:glycerol kinase